MKILSPLLSTKEVRPLSIAGADQFYCGLIDKNGQINDRPNTTKFNFSDIEELARAVKKANSLKKEIFLVINNSVLNIEDSINQALKAEEIGMTGVIAANLLLMEKLRKMNLSIELCASCITAVLNSEGARFLERFGVKTIHLPRHVGLNDLAAMKKNKSDAKLSVFAMNGMCSNIEAFCSLHSLQEEYFIPCKYFKTSRIIGDGTISKRMIDRRIKCKPFSCGVCAFKRLREIGIDSIKIEGRQIPLNEKVVSVEITKRCVEMSKKDIDEVEYQKFCRGLFKQYFKQDCNIEYCYF